MTGGIVMFAFLIPFALIFINRRKSRVIPIVTREMKDQKVKCTAPRADVVANNFLAQSWHTRAVSRVKVFRLLQLNWKASMPLKSACYVRRIAYGQFAFNEI